jgi:hypothetical protein
MHFYLLFLYQNFVREQIAYHRQMAERLESLYWDCWQDGGAPPAPNQTGPNQTGGAARKPQRPAGTLDAWDAESIYEEVP